MKRWLLCSISSKIYPQRDTCPDHGTNCSIFVVPEITDVWPLKQHIYQLEEALREQEEFYGNRIGILESRSLRLERDAEWMHKAEACIQQLEEALRFYADEENWSECEDPEHPDGYWAWLGPDYGNDEGPAIAREALSRDPSEAPEKEED